MGEGLGYRRKVTPKRTLSLGHGGKVQVGGGDGKSVLKQADKERRRRYEYGVMGEGGGEGRGEGGPVESGEGGGKYLG